MYETHSPVEDRFGYSSKGMFRCSRPSERIVLIVTAAVTLFLAFAGYYVLYLSFMWYVDKSQSFDSARSFGLMYVVFLAVLLIAAELIIGYTLSGHIYYYRADEKSFSFWSADAKISKTDIFYADAVALKYEEKRLFGKWLRGYSVTVMTRSLGNITFDYLFNKSAADKTVQNTPFHIIEERLDILQISQAVRQK